MPSSRGSSQPRDQTQFFCTSCIGTIASGFLTTSATWEAILASVKEICQVPNVYPFPCLSASLVAQLIKNPPAMQETWVWSLGWEDPLKKEKATHSSILAWRIPWCHRERLSLTHSNVYPQCPGYVFLASCHPNISVSRWLGTALSFSQITNTRWEYLLCPNQSWPQYTKRDLWVCGVGHGYI